MVGRYLVGWLGVRLVGWQVGRLVGRQGGWREIGRLAGSLVGREIGRLVHWRLVPKCSELSQPLKPLTTWLCVVLLFISAPPVGTGAPVVCVRVHCAQKHFSVLFGAR